MAASSRRLPSDVLGSTDTNPYRLSQARSGAASSVQNQSMRQARVNTIGLTRLYWKAIRMDRMYCRL